MYHTPCNADPGSKRTIPLHTFAMSSLHASLSRGSSLKSDALASIILSNSVLLVGWCERGGVERGGKGEVSRTAPYTQPLPTLGCQTLAVKSNEGGMGPLVGMRVGVGQPPWVVVGGEEGRGRGGGGGDEEDEAVERG